MVRPEVHMEVLLIGTLCRHRFMQIYPEVLGVRYDTAHEADSYIILQRLE